MEDPEGSAHDVPAVYLCRKFVASVRHDSRISRVERDGHKHGFPILELRGPLRLKAPLNPKDVSADSIPQDDSDLVGELQLQFSDLDDGGDLNAQRAWQSRTPQTRDSTAEDVEEPLTDRYRIADDE